MVQTTPAQRAELDIPAIRTRLAEMRGEYASELASGTLDRDSDTYQNAHRGFIEEVNDLDTYLGLRLNEQRAITPAQTMTALGMPSGTLADTRSEFKSPGRLVIEHEGFRAWCDANKNRAKLLGPSPEITLDALLGHGPEFRAAMETDTGSFGSYITVQQPIPPVLNQQRLFIRDLLTVVPTTATHIPYMRELPDVNALGASTVAESGDKPEVTVGVVDDNSVVQVIAGWLTITTQLLEDAPALQAWINSKLIYKLKYAEEAQLLNGNGVGSNLKGIRQFSDVQAQAFVTDMATTIGKACALIELQNGEANGVALNPADGWALLTHRASTSGVFDYANPWAPASMPTATIWGLPMVRTKSMETGKALVGDYRNGAMVYDRKQAGVRVYDQYGTLPTKNQVLLLAEERVALTVQSPTHFCVATLA